MQFAVAAAALFFFQEALHPLSNLQSATLWLLPCSIYGIDDDVYPQLASC